MLPIASYESSSDSEEEEIANESRSAVMPALPSFLSPASTPYDDPTQHQGRTRTQPHIENSWATYVYLEVPADAEVMRIIKHVTLESGVHPIIHHEGGDKLHISLSRCIYLKQHQLESFPQAIREHVNSPSITLAFAMISVLTNDEKTRSFVTAEVGAGYDKLARILGYVDKVVEAFRHPRFYQPPRFHASIAWSLEREPLEKAVGTIPEDSIDDLSRITYTVSSVVVKTGNRITRIPLKENI